MIAALWDADEDKITLGDKDIRDIPLRDYADKIAFVSQDNFLFNMTVRENIRLGRPSASDEEVKRVAVRSGCHDFILVWKTATIRRSVLREAIFPVAKDRE